jgi:hypothetical protein
MSTTEYVYRWHVAVPTADQAAANALWSLLAPGAVEAEALTFGVPCSASGKAPATHLSASTAATAEMRAVLDELRGAGLLGGLLIVECDALDPEASSWEDFLSMWGLKRIEREVKE